MSVAFTWLHAREAVNIGLFLSNICILFILSGVLLGEMRKAGWLNYPYNQAALVVAIYFIGMSLARLWGIVLLHTMRTGQDLVSLENTYPINFGGSIIAWVGTIAMIYVFAPEKSKAKAVGTVFILTGVAAVLSYIWG